MSMPTPARAAPESPLPQAGGEIVVERARGCVGARFRLHGRDPEYGLDCVGLVATATERAAPSGYAIRGGSPASIGEVLEKSGFLPGTGEPGDITLVEAGPAQFHLIVLTKRGFIHADAGLRRVVERPGSPPWPILSCWR